MALSVEQFVAEIPGYRERFQIAKDAGFDISVPANNAREAVQWTYFAYLAAIKQQNGAAMSARPSRCGARTRISMR